MYKFQLVSPLPLSRVRARVRTTSTRSTPEERALRPCRRPTYSAPPQRRSCGALSPRVAAAAALHAPAERLSQKRRIKSLSSPREPPTGRPDPYPPSSQYLPFALSPCWDGDWRLQQQVGPRRASQSKPQWQSRAIIRC